MQPKSQYLMGLCPYSIHSSERENAIYVPVGGAIAYVAFSEYSGFLLYDFFFPFYFIIK